MATTISFKKPATAPAQAPTTTAAPEGKVIGTATAVANTNVLPPPTASTAVVAAPQTQITTPEDYKGVGGFEGEFTSRDMATPYLAIFGKTTKGFEEHPDWLGQWVYDKSVPLGTELRVLFVRCTKWWVEDLPFGAEAIPQRFRTLADARAAGFNEGQLKESADLDLLIEVDAEAEGVADLAHIIDGDKGYIMARYGVRSTAYGRTVGILTKDASGYLKGNLINGFYKLTTQLKTGPKGTYFIPVLKVDGPSSPDLRKEIIARMGNVVG